MKLDKVGIGLEASFCVTLCCTHIISQETDIYTYTHIHIYSIYYVYVHRHIYIYTYTYTYGDSSIYIYIHLNIYIYPNYRDPPSKDIQVHYVTISESPFR